MRTAMTEISQGYQRTIEITPKPWIFTGAIQHPAHPTPLLLEEMGLGVEVHRTIQQRATTDYYTPYTFSAKERELETGYSYFGARHYDPNVSVWLSVDPMADILSWLSPYNYCELRPLRLIDPNGMLSDDPEKQIISSNPYFPEFLTTMVVTASVSKDSSPSIRKSEKPKFLNRIGNWLRSIFTSSPSLEQSDGYSNRGGIHFYSKSGRNKETAKVGPNSDARMAKVDYLAAAVGLRVPGPKPSSASPIESLAESASSLYGAVKEGEQLIINTKADWEASSSFEAFYVNPEGFKVSFKVPDDNKKAQNFLRSCSPNHSWGNPLTFKQYQQLKKYTNGL